MRVHGPALLVAAALGGLLLACRGGLPGIPVADDYDSLWALRFEHPIDPFGTFGSLWYWRPLGRQVYFMAVAPLLGAFPWIVGVLHAALFALLAWAGYRAAGRAFDSRAAAAIAAFPLLAEPSRALLVWPTGGQPLLALAGIALALHFAAGRRLVPALAAALLALLAHEQALLALPLVPLVARSGVRGFLATAGVAGAWAAARLVAASHGAAFPLLVGPQGALAAVPSLLASSLLVQLDLAELEGPVRSAGAVALALCGACALVLFLVRGQSRERLRAHGLVLGVAGAWFLLALAPLTFAPELWTPRHSVIPGLGLGLLVVGLLACASPRLAVAFTALRLVLLLAAPTAPAVVEAGFPPRSRPLSFLHVTRMQRTVDSARRTLTEARPTLPPGATVGYWSLPRNVEIGFAGDRAVETWYADSTLAFRFWDRFEPEAELPAAVLAFETGRADPARLMTTEAMVALRRALVVGEAGDLAAADDALVAALAAQDPPVETFTVEVVRLRARLAFRADALAQADSLNAVDRELAGESAAYHGLAALLAARRGDALGAQQHAARAFALRPGDYEAREALDALAAPATVELAEF